jgi:hypothetical protein
MAGRARDARGAYSRRVVVLRGKTCALVSQIEVFAATYSLQARFAPMIIWV